MAIGVRIRTSGGVTQIDQDYNNLFLVDKHTNTISTVGTANYDYAIAGDVIALAVKVWPETFTTTSVVYSGGVWTYRLTFYNNPDTTGTCTFTIYAFGKAPTPTSTIGLKVKKPSGEIIYHSQFKPLRIVAVLGSSVGYTGAAGRDLAVMVLGTTLFSTVVFPVVVYDTYSARVTGNVIDVLRLTISSGAAGLFRGGSYAAVDVTNY